MYTKGALLLEPKPEKYETTIYDSGLHGDHGWPYAYLGHRCDSWVIGGPQQVRDLINDLNEALRRMTEMQHYPERDDDEVDND